MLPHPAPTFLYAPPAGRTWMDDERDALARIYGQPHPASSFSRLRAEMRDARKKTLEMVRRNGREPVVVLYEECFGDTTLEDRYEVGAAFVRSLGGTLHRERFSDPAPFAIPQRRGWQQAQTLVRGGFADAIVTTFLGPAVTVPHLQHEVSYLRLRCAFLAVTGSKSWRAA